MTRRRGKLAIAIATEAFAPNGARLALVLTVLAASSTPAAAQRGVALGEGSFKNAIVLIGRINNDTKDDMVRLIPKATTSTYAGVAK